MKRISTHAVGWILSVCLLIANTVSAQSTLVIGTDILNTNGSTVDPVEGYYNSEHYQLIYLASELSARGMTGGAQITGLGFSISEAYAGASGLGNYTINVGHTSVSSLTVNNTDATTTVKNAFTYIPTATAAGAFDMITFDSPFTWDGLSNLVIDLCTGAANDYTSPYGGLRYTDFTNGMMYVRQDGASICGTDVASTSSSRPNIQFSYIPAPGCTGVPTAGTITLSSNSGSPESIFTTSVTGTTQASDIVYQWQKSSDGSTGWTDISGAISANDSITAENTLNAITYYRLKATCANTNDSSFSNILSYTITYCIPTVSGSTYYLDTIETTNGITNLNYTASAYSTGYVDNSATSFSQYSGGSLSVRLHLSTTSTDYHYCWIDWNGDGDFTDVGDNVFATDAYTDGYTGAINIPIGQAVGDYKVRFAASELGSITACTGNAYSNYVDYTLTVLTSPDCAGTPDAGTATVIPIYSSPGSSYSVSSSGFSLANGMTFQWQSNTDNTGWTNAGSLLSEYADYTGTIPALGSHTDNRLIVSCSAFGLSDTSNITTVTGGYCGSPLSNTTNAVDIITNVVLTNSLGASYSNASASNGTDNYDIYNNAPISLYVGSTSNQLALTFGSDDTQYSAGWIDFDHNGIFDSIENIALATSSADGGATATYIFTIPDNAVQGITRLRVRGGSDDSYTATDACAIIGYGETEDYNVNITTVQTCTGTPDAGVLTVTPSSGLTGTTVSVSATGFTAGDGISYQWQSNANGSGWINRDTSSTVFSALSDNPTTNTGYRLIITCLTSSTSDTSATSSFTRFNNSKVVPVTGNNSVACGTNTLLFDNGGQNSDYESHSDGYTVLNAGSIDAIISISGSYMTENDYDYIKIYDGSDNTGTLLQSYSGTGTINYIGNQGQTLTVEFTSDFGGESSGFALAVTYSGTCYSPCSGTPTAGTASVSPTQNSEGSAYNAMAVGYSLAANLSFQWQSNTDNAGWVSTGASDSVYSDLNGLVAGSFGSTAQYRLIVTCNVSGESDTSSVAIFTSDYCIPASSIDDESGITSVSLTGFGTTLNNTSDGDPGYSDYTNIPVTVYIGQTYMLSVEVDDPYYDGIYTKAWIDWNQNGDFSDDNSELDLGEAYGSSEVTYNSPLSVIIPPVTPGAYRVRIRATREYDDDYNDQEPTPCGDQDYSEAEDYILNIVPVPVCTGTPNAGTVSVSPVQNGAGTTYDAMSTDYSIARNLSFQWQSNTDNAGWVSAGTSDTTYSDLNGLVAGNLGSIAQYRLIVMCTASGERDTSSVATFTSGYCSPNGTASGSYIDNFTTTGGVTNVDNSSDYSNAGYGNYTTDTITQVVSSSIDFSIDITGGTVGAAIWGDWNHDGTFDASEQVYVTGAYSNGPFTGSFNIPAGATIGATSLRVLIDFNRSIPEDPCSFGSGRGEVEDYTIVVQAAEVPAPTIGSFTPANGCANASTVVITGTNFTNATSVTIGGTAASSFTVNSSTQITASVGSGTSGVIRVTTASGTATTTAVFTVNTPATTTQSFTLCPGETVTVGSHTYSASGTYHDTLQTAVGGCDSIVITTVNSNNAINTSVSVAGVTATVATSNATYQWINCTSGQAVAGATAQSFTAAVSDNYKVAVTLNSCSDTSDCVNLVADTTHTGIKDMDWAKAINVYPNPTTGVATIAITNFNASDLIITITDIQGQLVFQSEESVHSSNYSTTINLSNAAKGVYLVKLNTGNSFAVKQLVLQ